MADGSKALAGNARSEPDKENNDSRLSIPVDFHSWFFSFKFSLNSTSVFIVLYTNSLFHLSRSHLISQSIKYAIKHPAPLQLPYNPHPSPTQTANPSNQKRQKTKDKNNKYGQQQQKDKDKEHRCHCHRPLLPHRIPQTHLRCL